MQINCRSGLDKEAIREILLTNKYISPTAQWVDVGKFAHEMPLATGGIIELRFEPKGRLGFNMFVNFRGKGSIQVRKECSELFKRYKPGLPFDKPGAPESVQLRDDDMDHSGAETGADVECRRKIDGIWRKVSVKTMIMLGKTARSTFKEDSHDRQE